MTCLHQIGYSFLSHLVPPDLPDERVEDVVHVLPVRSRRLDEGARELARQGRALLVAHATLTGRPRLPPTSIRLQAMTLPAA